MNHQFGTGDGKQNRRHVQEPEHHHHWSFMSPTASPAGDSPILRGNLHQQYFMPSPSRGLLPPRSVAPPPRRFGNNNNNNIQFSRRSPNDTDEEYEELLPLIERSEARRVKEILQNSPQRKSLRDKGELELGLIRLWKSVIKDIQEEYTYLFSMGMTSMTPYKVENVRRTALFSRLILICIQMFACLTLPAHNNDGFRTYGDDGVEGTMMDRMINATIGGLTNWDGQYFLHVATRGYTHENTMAFFPLFPLTIRFFSQLVHPFISFFLTFHSVTLILGVGFNIWCFQNAAVALSQLVLHQAGKNVELAQHLLPTVIYLFCYNPASIFFTAFYTESLFAWLTFSCILALGQRNFDQAIGYASLSAVCRSNGLLNFGLIGLVALGDTAGAKGSTTSIAVGEPMGSRVCLVERYTEGLIRLVKVGLMCLVGLIPFGLFQLYCAKEFCVPDRTDPIPAFCFYNGLPYTYIQAANWNVGFLQYFEMKQIPNFVLAAPVLFTLGFEARRHAKRYGLQLLALREAFYEDILDLALSFHGLFLTFFCLFFVHVQVSTRMIMSACPYIYIYIAKNLLDERWLYLSRIIHFTSYTTFINLWFGMYFLVGTVGFSLGYPWT